MISDTGLGGERRMVLRTPPSSWISLTSVDPFEIFMTILLLVSSFAAGGECLTSYFSSMASIAVSVRLSGLSCRRSSTCEGLVTAGGT